MFHLYGRIKGFRPKSIKLLKTRPTLTVFQFFFFSNLLMSNMYLMCMDMINEDRFTYCVLITYTTLNDFQEASRFSYESEIFEL